MQKISQIIKGDSADCRICGKKYIANAANQRTCSAACSTQYLLITNKERQNRSISNIARNVIWTRDRHICVYCRKQVGPGSRCIDHIVSVANGGRSNPENLVTACQDCNKSKASRRLSPERENALLAYAKEASKSIVWDSTYTDALDKQKRYSMYDKD